jgi:hypothetical protein
MASSSSNSARLLIMWIKPFSRGVLSVSVGAPSSASSYSVMAVHSAMKVPSSSSSIGNDRSSNAREAILAAARRTAQAHGYGGLNFRDLANEVGIKAASIHYHFPSKADLGAALLGGHSS